MRANVWSGRNTVQVENVPDPQILNDRDAIVKISSTAICGSDLHLYNGHIPTMERGDILGHEFMGEIVETGAGVTNLKSAIAWSCRSRSPAATAASASRSCTRVCENSNPNAGIAEKIWGHATAGLFGYSHLPAATPADRPSTRGCRSRTWARSRSRRPSRRAGAVPVRHLPHRLHGRGDV